MTVILVMLIIAVIAFALEKVGQGFVAFTLVEGINVGNNSYNLHNIFLYIFLTSASISKISM